MKNDTKAAIFAALTIIGGVAVAMLSFFYGRYILYGLGVILAILLVKLVVVPMHDIRAQTALQRAEAKKIRAEAKRIHRETRILSELHDQNMESFPSVFFHKPDTNGNFALPIGRDGRLVTHLLPGNTATGNGGIPPKMVLDYLQQQNTVEGEIWEEDEEEEQQQIARPKILLSQQIEQGLTSWGEEESVFGYPIDTYEPFCVPLFKKEGNFIDSLMVIGMQGQGKSTIGTYFAGLTVNHGGHLLLIDPDAQEDQSLSNRLGPLKSFLLMEVADTPEKAERLLRLAEDEIDTPSDFPLLLLVDEFSMIMRHKQLKGKWQEVADMVANTVENYATRGRKRRRRAIVFGQISNATRTGGTELRDSCAYIIFNTPLRKAALVLQDASDEDIETLAPSLTPGMAIVSPAKSSDTYIMQFTFPDDQGLQIIAEVRSESDELEGSSHVQDTFTDGLSTDTVHERSELLNVDELALQADVRKVRNLYGKQNQDEIIYMLWGARKGGTKRYQEARTRYQAIAMFIETGQWPDVRQA